VTAGPYRKEDLPPIRIEPDRRGFHLAMMLLLGVLLGIGGDSFVRRLSSNLEQAATTSSPKATGGLEGQKVVLPPQPSGTTVPDGPLVVHVWLQGCADCMTAFEAMRSISAQGGLGVPQVNVAYGSADGAWAKSYGVDERLVVDTGNTVVTPLGISSFTTLVLDADHVVRLVDRPDRPGYLFRIQGAYHALASIPAPHGNRSANAGSRDPRAE
jgi:hypothetical protein